MSGSENVKKVTIIGDGGWGTALAIVLSRKRCPVSLWGVFPEYIRQVARSRENKKFLPGHRIPESVEVTENLDRARDGAALVILAVPSKFLRAVLTDFQLTRDDDPLFVSAIKGIESGTLLRMSQVIAEHLGEGAKIAVISGPTIASEVASGMPATVVASSAVANHARLVQSVLMDDAFRVYTSDDLTGVELGGSLKNVIAIAAGTAESLGFGTNARAALLTRGLAEISRLGVAMGAQPGTFAGLSGMGDMITTCMSRASRNRWFGEMLGKGKKTEDIVRETEMVVEGVITTQSAYTLSRQFSVDMPITGEMYRVIYGNKPPRDAVRDLMTRSAKPEIY